MTDHMEIAFLEELLVCPLCKGELNRSPDRASCSSCALVFPHLGDDSFDLLPGSFLKDGGSQWRKRQEEMTAWYRELVSRPSQAASYFLNRYTPFSTLLAAATGNVLDVGGANGVTRSYLQRDVRYVVVDPSLHWRDSDWLSLVDTFPLLRERTRFIRGVGEHLPFRDGTFDAVLALWSLNHVCRPKEVFDEAHRVLKAGGTFLVVLDDIEPTLHDLFSRRFQEGAMSQVASAVRTGRDSVSRRLIDRTFPTGRSRDVATLLAAKLRRVLGGSWPVRSEHTYIRESDLRSWSARHFEVVRRVWISQYLTYEFRRGRQR